MSYRADLKNKIDSLIDAITNFKTKVVEKLNWLYNNKADKDDVYYNDKIPADQFTATEVANLKAGKLDNGNTPWTANNYYSNSDAISAINADSDHGSTASHNYFSGNYNDLANRPDIPDNNNDLTNGAGYITFDDVDKEYVDPPSHSTSYGIKGQKSLDDDFVYECYAENRWARYARDKTFMPTDVELFIVDDKAILTNDGNVITI